MKALLGAGAGLVVVIAALAVARRSRLVPAKVATDIGPDAKRGTMPLPSGAPSLTAEWELYHGARPEVLGWPENTILALPGLVKASPAVRAGVLDVARELDIPVDVLATVIESESGWNPAALNPLPAAGLVQLTVGANLPGFGSADKVREIITWSAERQLHEVVLPLWKRYGVGGKAITPGHGYMLNFLPSDAGKGGDHVLGDKRQEPPPDSDDSAEAKHARWLFKVYKLNPGFDVQKRGFFTVDDVHTVAARVAARAKGQRISIDGTLLVPGGGDAVARPTSPAASVPRASSLTASHSLVDAAKTEPSEPDEPEPPAAPSSSSSSSSASSPPLGSKVGGWLLAAVRDGQEKPPRFVTIPWGDLMVEVSTDALQAEVEGYGSLRLPVSWAETVQICKLRHLVPLVAELSDAIFAAASTKLPPRPRGKWGTKADGLKTSSDMMTLDYCVQQSRYLDGLTSSSDGLCADAGKDWILSKRLALAPHLGVTYGWRYPNGKPIQGLGPDTKIPAHNDKHYDYSQVFRCVQRFATRAGERVDLLDHYASLGMPADILASLRG